MRKKLKEKISEALSSVLPITVIVLLLSFTVTPMPIGTLLLFLLGAAMLIVGMGFFSLGADMAMMPMGDQMGHGLGRNGSLALILGVCFLIGVTVTIAEPDLQVLAQQVPAVPDLVIILAVAAGVGRAADVSVRPEEDLVTVPAEVPVLAHLVAGTKRRWVPLVLPRWVESKM